MKLFNKIFKKASPMKEIKPVIGQVDNILAIASGKGGVGKSTVTTNLAFALTAKGYKVGVLDADLYGPSQSTMFGKNDKAQAKDGYAIPIENHGVKYISLSAVNTSSGAAIMRGPIPVKILHQFLSAVLWGELDYLLIDLPPGTGDIQLTLSQQARLTGGIIVTTPQKVAREISAKAIDMFNTVNVPIVGVVENMSGFTCENCGHTTEIFKSGGGQQVANECDVPFLGQIPLDPAVMMSGDDGQSIIDKKDDHPLKKILVGIAEKTTEQVERLTGDDKMIEPTKLAVYEDSGRFKVFWNNGEESEFDPYELRLACPCASCVEETTGKRILDVDSVPLDIKVVKANTVGRYGISIHFSDNHSTGIYKISSLREMAKKEQGVAL